MTEDASSPVSPWSLSRSARSTPSEGPPPRDRKPSSRAEDPSASGHDNLDVSTKSVSARSQQDSCPPSAKNSLAGRASSSTSAYVPELEREGRSDSVLNDFDIKGGLDHTSPSATSGASSPVMWAKSFDFDAGASHALRRRQSAPPWNGGGGAREGKYAADAPILQNAARSPTAANADIDVETAEWMAGLRGSTMEDEGLPDDPMVFGSGFKPARRPRRSSTGIRNQAPRSPSSPGVEAGQRSPCRSFQQDSTVDGGRASPQAPASPVHQTQSFSGFSATAAPEKPPLDARREAARQEAQFRAVHERIRGNAPASASARPEMRPRVKVEPPKPCSPKAESNRDSQARTESRSQPAPSTTPTVPAKGAEPRMPAGSPPEPQAKPKPQQTHSKHHYPGRGFAEQAHRSSAHPPRFHVPPSGSGRARPGGSDARHAGRAGVGKPQPFSAGTKGGEKGSLDTLKAEILRLHKMPSKAERKKKFLQLCFQWHPDKNPSDAQFATRGFQLLQERKAALLS